MRGFESYSPLSWIEDVFSVHIQEPVARTFKSVRSGKWASSTRGTVAIIVCSAAAFVSGPSIAAPTGISSPVQSVRSLGSQVGSEYAPAGYMRALADAIRRAPRLPEPVAEGEPEFLF
jgi:hypothetical protein